MSVQGRPTVEVISLFREEMVSSPEKVSCKFVVVANHTHYIMIVGDIGTYPYHANLLDGFSKRSSVARHWVRRPDQLQLDDPHYRVLGGGYLELDGVKKRARLSGSSKAYGYFDLDAVQTITSVSAFFQGFAVSIEI